MRTSHKPRLLSRALIARTQKRLRFYLWDVKERERIEAESRRFNERFPLKPWDEAANELRLDECIAKALGND